MDKYVEFLYALLHYQPEDYISSTRYYRPEIPCEAERHTTNTGVSVDSLMRCGHNPYLVARRARNVSLVDHEADKPLLCWTEPDSLICDPVTRLVIERRPGRRNVAPVNLPLRIIGME
jgi:hypothetical protein